MPVSHPPFCFLGIFPENEEKEGKCLRARPEFFPSPNERRQNSVKKSKGCPSLVRFWGKQKMNEAVKEV